jgi:two-component system phosphate regulon sensor histidine kinase PhoR
MPDKTNGISADGDIIGHVENEVALYRKEKSSEIEKLKELEKYRRDFLGNVSHELKTPIFNIQGYILTLLDGGINDANINMLYLKRTEKSINRIITIVEDLEAISRLESGELQLTMQEFNILRVTEEVFEMHQLLAHEKNIILRTNAQNQKSIAVFGDKKQIIIALSNLVVNAIKYGKKEGYVKVGFYDMDDKWLIEVSDNGIGVEAKHLPRIFERFYRVDKSRAREEGGTGLGLSIVKHIIDAHKQTLTVKSVPGEGTSFTFTLDKKKNIT